MAEPHAANLVEPSSTMSSSSSSPPSNSGAAEAEAPRSGWRASRFRYDASTPLPRPRRTAAAAAADSDSRSQVLEDGRRAGQVSRGCSHADGSTRQAPQRGRRAAAAARQAAQAPPLRRTLPLPLPLPRSLPPSQHWLSTLSSLLESSLLPRGSARPWLATSRARGETAASSRTTAPSTCATSSLISDPSATTIECAAGMHLVAW